MSWKIKEGFLLVQGKKAINPEMSKPYPPVKSLKESKSVYVIYFKGILKGLKLAKNKFAGQQNELQKLKITAKPAAKKGKTGRQKMPQVLDIEIDQSTAVTAPFEKEKLVGEFTVAIADITPAPEEYENRTVRKDWVLTLKKRLRQSRALPSGFTVPVLLDPAKCKSAEEFRRSESQLGDYKIFMLGGNHLIQALKELKAEGVHFSSEVNICLYVGLTPEEGRSIGNKHNFIMATLPVTFQQKIEQTRKFFDEGIVGADLVKKIKKINQETDGTKLMNDDSCSTIKSVATYSEHAYEIFREIVEKHEQVHGCDTNLPQRLFRALQGCNEENKLSFLSQALEDGLQKTALHIEKARAWETIKITFIKNVGVSSWEEAVIKYPNVDVELEKFVEKKNRRKYVPEELIAFCKEKISKSASNQQVNQAEEEQEQEQETQAPSSDCEHDEDFNINITVQYKNKSIVENENVKKILELHHKLILKSLLKIQNLEE